MSQCVPSWDLHENPSSAPASASATARLSLRSNSHSSAVPDVPMLDYEVAELTWENGQLAMHGLGPPRVSSKSSTSATWDKPLPSGTLESIVDQATKTQFIDDLVPWFDPNRASAAVTVPSATMTMDALVPCAHQNEEVQATAARVLDSVPGLRGTCMVGSCSGVADKRVRAARVPVAPEWSAMDHSVSASATMGRDSQQMTLDTYDKDLGMGFTSTSFGSAENTSSGKRKAAATADDHDSVCHSRPHERKEGDEEKKKGTGKSSVSTKRSRAAAIHNQSERKRRDKINQRMKTLQKLVPNSNKTDKASMLDEVIEYLKQLQAQVQMMSRMNMPAMLLPLAMQQQLQMSMMAPAMGMMGMGMPGVMDMNSMAGRPNIPGMSPAAVLHPSAFMPTMTSWDGAGAGDRLQPNPTSVMGDPLSTFLACQSQQPMTMDAYSRMAAMYQQQLQQQQQAGSNNKS